MSHRSQAPEIRSRTWCQVACLVGLAAVLGGCRPGLRESEQLGSTLRASAVVLVVGVLLLALVLHGRVAEARRISDLKEKIKNATGRRRERLVRKLARMTPAPSEDDDAEIGLAALLLDAYSGDDDD